MPPFIMFSIDTVVYFSNMVPDMQTFPSGIKILADYVHARWPTPLSSGFFLLMCTGHTEVQTWWRVWEISACGERRHVWACGQRHVGQQRWRHLDVVVVRRLWSCRTCWLDLARPEDPVGCRWGAQRAWSGEDMLESLSISLDLLTHMVVNLLSSKLWNIFIFSCSLPWLPGFWTHKASLHIRCDFCGVARMGIVQVRAKVVQDSLERE
jgi:hypothetical protein